MPIAETTEALPDAAVTEKKGPASSERFDLTKLFNLDRRSRSQKSLSDEDEPEVDASAKLEPPSSQLAHAGSKSNTKIIAGMLGASKNDPWAEKKNETQKAVATPRPKPKVSTALLRHWHDKLVHRINAAAEAGNPLTGMVKIQGRTKAYRLLGADEQELRIAINDNSMPVGWNWLSPWDKASLVRSLTSEEDLEGQLMLAVFMRAAGDIQSSRLALRRAQMLDAELAAELRNALE